MVRNVCAGRGKGKRNQDCDCQHVGNRQGSLETTNLYVCNCRALKDFSFTLRFIVT